MFSRRNVTLIGSTLLFTTVSVALYALAGWEAVVFPAYGLIFPYNDWRREEETHVIFLFLVLIAAFLISTRIESSLTIGAMIVEAFGLMLLSFGLGRHRGRLSAESYRIRGLVEKLDLRIRDQERELTFYKTYETTALNQVRLRRDLTQAAKSLGNTMDANEVRHRLTGILEGRYKGSTVKILPGQPQDPLVQYSLKSRAPVLVKDMAKEVRFGPREKAPEFRSALVVPLTVMKSPYGFVRMDSGKTAAYSNDDLKTVDLFATLASLTLENIQLYDRVHNLASTDSLTGLATQRTFLQRLKEEILRAGRAQTPVSLIMLDVDHFKKCNDTFGHQAGDEVLRVVSRILVSRVRPVDCVARYGGEEFMIILPAIDHDQAMEVAETVRASIEAEPLVFEGARSSVTVSLGVSSFPKDATSQSQLIRIADERLYRSKSGGRNRVSG
jgi:diguanylate cyclase (GGDEF)-like protein